jgi:hypothetical protein
MLSDRAPKKKRCKRSAHNKTVASSKNSSTQKQVASLRPRKSRPRNNSYAAFGKWTPQKHKTWCHPGLRAGPSTIQGAGTGVFATQPIKAGTHLGYYCGRVYWRYPKQNARDWAYMLHLERRPPWIPVDVWHLKRTLKRNLNSSATQAETRAAKGGSFKKTAKAAACVCVDGRGTLSLINCCHGKCRGISHETTTHLSRDSVAELNTRNSEPTAQGAKRNNTKGSRCKDDNKKRRRQVVVRENCTFGSTGRFKTTRDINIGQELFVDYGAGYWEER